VLRLPALRRSRELSTPPYFTVFRSRFDAWFAQEAVDAGAELFTATLVEDLLWEDGRVAGVRTARGDLRARVVIGADGVNSTVAEKSGCELDGGRKIGIGRSTIARRGIVDRAAGPRSAG